MGKFNMPKSILFTTLVHYTKINVLCTINSQIFNEVNLPVIKFKNSLSVKLRNFTITIKRLTLSFPAKYILPTFSIRFPDVKLII